MQPIIGIDNTGDVVPTGVVVPPHPQQLVQQPLQPQVPRGGNGLQIPTSMEQMTAQATSLLKKIAPTPQAPRPPAQPPGQSTKIQSGPMQIAGSGDAHDTDMVIGGKTLLQYAFKVAHNF